MSANVFFVIIPNQKKVVADLQAGRDPEPSLGLQAKQRSLHNNYLTLPVVLLMVSFHYPVLFGGGAERGWVVIALILLIGGVVRHFFNSQHAGLTGRALLWQWPTAALLSVALIVFLSPAYVITKSIAVSDDRALSIITTHCASCHATEPADLAFQSPPAGLQPRESRAPPYPRQKGSRPSGHKPCYATWQPDRYDSGRTRPNWVRGFKKTADRGIGLRALAS